MRHAGEPLHVDAEVDPHRLSDTVRASRGCRWSWPSPRRSAASPRWRWKSGTEFQHGPSTRGRWTLRSPRSSAATRVAPCSPPRASARWRPSAKSCVLPNSRPMRMPASPASGGRLPRSLMPAGASSQVKTTAEPMTAKTSVSSEQRAADDRGPRRHVRVLGHRSLVRGQLRHRARAEPDGERVAVDAHLDVVVERHDHQALPRGELVGREERAGALARRRLAHEHGVVAGGGEGQRLEACGAADGQARLGGVGCSAPSSSMVSAVECGEGRCQGGDALDGDRVEDELDVPDAELREGPQRRRQRARVAGDRIERLVASRRSRARARREAPRPARPSAPPRPGRAPPLGTPRRPARGPRRSRRPSCRTTGPRHSTPATCGSVIESIRGPIEPTISGGPPGRAGGGTSGRSRAS